MLRRSSSSILALLAASLVGTADRETRAAPPNPFQPNDSFVVAYSGAPLMRGYDTLAALPQGETLKVLKVEGPWVGTTVMVDGRKVGGWVWCGQAATAERYAAMQQSRRRYSFAPTPSYGGYGAYGGYGDSDYVGTVGVLPNQDSPNRLSIGDTPYGPRYWRADKKIIGY